MRILTKKYLSKIDEIKTKGYITPGFDQKNPSDYLPYCELDNIQWGILEPHSLLLIKFW